MTRLSVDTSGSDERRSTPVRAARTNAEAAATSGEHPERAVRSGAKFQDGPELAYQKLQREMAAHDNQPAHDTFTVTEAEFEAFKEAHRPQARPRRGNAAAAAAAGGVVPGEPHLG